MEMYIFLLIMNIGQYGANAQTISLDSIDDVTEGADSVFVLSVSVDSNVGSTVTATLMVDTSVSTAIPGYDFGGSGTYFCVVPVSTATGSVSIAINDDNLIENFELVTIDLIDAESLNISNSDNMESFILFTGSGDTGKVQVNFLSSTYEVEEDQGTLILKLEFSDQNGLPTVINEPTVLTLTLPCVSTDTATNGVDYENVTTSITLPKSGDSTIDITLDIIDDGDEETTEVFILSLDSLSDTMYAEIGSLRAKTSIRIKDNDVEDFICISTTPEVFRRSTAQFTFYAISNKPAIVNAVKWSKANLISKLGSLTVLNDGSSNYAQKLTVDALGRNTNRRFGAYTFESGDKSCTVFVKAKSDVLNYPENMTQKYTLTIYPTTQNDTALNTSKTFGISYTKLNRWDTLVWKKNNKKIKNTGKTLTVTDTSEAGIYQISRKKRGRRGWFAIFQLIASVCPRKWYQDGEGRCTLPCGECLNGGTCDYLTGRCMCQPCFEGSKCELVETTTGTFGQARRFSCTDFGLNSACEGGLFGYERNYGNTCGCGWSGTDCLAHCTGGTFGADCSLECHCKNNQFCNFRTGVCSNGVCENGYEGENCQIKK